MRECTKNFLGHLSDVATRIFIVILAILVVIPYNIDLMVDTDTIDSIKSYAAGIVGGNTGSVGNGFRVKGGILGISGSQLGTESSVAVGLVFGTPGSDEYLIDETHDYETFVQNPIVWNGLSDPTYVTFYAMRDIEHKWPEQITLASYDSNHNLNYTTDLTSITWLNGNGRSTPGSKDVFYSRLLNAIKADDGAFASGGYMSILNGYTSADITNSKNNIEYMFFSGNGGSLHTKERFKELFGTGDKASREEKKAKYLDFLYQLYITARAPQTQSYILKGIEIIAKDEYEQNPFCVTCKPGVMVGSYDNKLFMMTCQDYLSFYTGIDGNMLLHTSTFKASSSASAGSYYNMMKLAIESSLRSSPNITRFSSGATNANAFARGVSALLKQRIRTNKTTMYWTGTTVSSRLQENLWVHDTRGDSVANAGGSSTALYGEILMVYQNEQGSNSLGLLVAEPDDYPVDGSKNGGLLNKNVDLTLYPGVTSESGLNKWDTIINNAEADPNFTGFNITAKLSKSCDYAGWLGYGGNYTVDWSNTTTMSASTFRAALHGNTPLLNNIDITSNYKVPDIAGETKITLTYFADLKVEATINGKKQTWKYTSKDDVTDDASFIITKDSEERIRYISTPEAYAELKNYGAGSNQSGSLNEDWEVMAGIPTTEQLYYAVGGSEFIVDISLEYVPHEKAVRSYISYFSGRECEYKKDDAINSGVHFDVTNDSHISVPGNYKLRSFTQNKDSTSFSGGGNLFTDNSIGCDHENGGDWEISFTITGDAECGADSGAETWHSCSICGARVEDSHTYIDTAPYSDAMSAMSELASTLRSTPVKWTSTSEGSNHNSYNKEGGIERTAYWQVSVSSSSDFGDHTSAGNDGSDCDGNHTCTGHPWGPDEDGNSGIDYNSVSPCTPGSVCSGSHAWSITLTARLKDHEVCGPCCSHDLPDIYDTWAQTWEYDTMKITDVHVWQIDQGAASGLSEVIGGGVDIQDNYTSVTVNNVEGTSYTLDGAYENKNGVPDGVAGAEIKTNPPTMFYNIALKNSNDLVGHGPGATSINYTTQDGIGKATESSLVGRIRYLGYAPEQHDVVLTDLGQRTDCCDGMAVTYPTNVIKGGGGGHSETWGCGFEYAAFRGTASPRGHTSTAVDVSKLAVSQTAGGVNNNGGNKHIGAAENSRTIRSGIWNVCGQTNFPTDQIGYLQTRCDGYYTVSVTNGGGTDFTADENADVKTEEYKKLLKIRQTSPNPVMITDLLILQTTSGDQSVMYFAGKPAGAITVTSDDVKNYQYGYKYDADGKLITEGSVTAPVTLESRIPTTQFSKEKMWDGNGQSASKWDDDEINVGGYNGGYANPNTKFNGTGNGERVETMFDNDAAKTIVRDQRPAKKLMIYSRPLNIDTEIENKNYLTFGIDSEVFWANELHWTAGYSKSLGTRNNPILTPAYSIADTIADTEFNFNQYKDNTTDWAQTFANTEKAYKGYIDKTKYSPTHNIPFNAIIIQDPISSEEYSLVSLPNERDQRYSNTIDPDMWNKLLDANLFCPGTAAECEFATLNCHYGETEILAAYNFDDGTMKNAKTESVTNLPGGWNITSGKLNSSGTNGVAISMGSELGIYYQSGTHIQVDADVTILANNGIDHNNDGATDTRISRMVYSFAGVGLYMSTNGKLGFITKDGQYKETVNPVVNAQNVYQGALRAEFSFLGLSGCKLYINGVEQAMTSSSTEAVKFNSATIGNYFYIGGSPQFLYPAVNSIDNIVIRRLAGTYNHTDECYTVQMTHPSGMNAHVHTKDCLNTDPTTVSGLQYTTVNGVNYVKVFEHFTSEGLFTSEAQALLNKQKGKFSVLSLIDNLKAPGTYKFMLYYPEMGKMNVWEQRKNPLNCTQANTTSGHSVDGYNPINVQMTGEYFGGLERSTTSNTLLDGSTGHGNWWYAIGAYNEHPTAGSGTIPGGDTVNVTQAQLWLACSDAVKNQSKYVKLSESYPSKKVYEFGYTGSMQQATLPAGVYLLETWGAQGGGYNASVTGGKGGYSTGTLTLTSASTVYVGVGGAGSWGFSATGGFNGGGSISHNSSYQQGAGSGGGATHIATAPGELKNLSGNAGSVLIVAAGGGGGVSGNDGGHSGGAGGGTTGLNGSGSGYGTPSAGTQTSGGRYGNTENHTYYSAGTFGAGGSGSGSGNTWYGGAGGGGYYGGGYGGTHWSGAGGSGYVNASRLSSASTVAGSTSFTSPTGASEVGHSGNGYARITRIGGTDGAYDPSGLTYNVDNAGYYYYKSLYESGQLTRDDLVRIFGEELVYQMFANKGNVSTKTNFTNWNGIQSKYNCDVSTKTSKLIVAVQGTSPYFTFRYDGVGDAGVLSLTLNNKTDGTKAKLSWARSVAGLANAPEITTTMDPKANNQTLHFYLSDSTAWDGTANYFKLTIPADDDRNYGDTVEITGMSFNYKKPENVSYEFSGNTNPYSYTANASGYYLLEVWGANGGGGARNGSTGSVGGIGGYSKGVVKLSAGEKLYTYIGGAGSYAGGTFGGAGFNGGGNGASTGYGGGGMTHISKTNTDRFGVTSNYSTSTKTDTLYGKGQTWTYGYTGAMQSVALRAGTYTLEAWGAQGGGSYGGLGGYSKGTITLNSDTVLYIGVGGQGSTFNGGGYGRDLGGGATHIATADGVLSNLSGNKSAVLLVAGGGGGTGGRSNSGRGGSGGGANQQGTAGADWCGSPGQGGTLTSAGSGGSNHGYSGSFGQGGSAGGCGYSNNGSAGGGGGYYGGGGGGHDCPTFNDYDDSGAGGGSGYAKNTLTGVTGITGNNSGNGKVVITAAADIKHTVTTEKISHNETASFSTGSALIVAGGGGGADNADGGVLRGDDDGSGGEGGGLTGGAAYVNGIIVGDTVKLNHVLTNTVAGSRSAATPYLWYCQTTSGCGYRGMFAYTNSTTLRSSDINGHGGCGGWVRLPQYDDLSVMKGLGGTQTGGYKHGLGQSPGKMTDTGGAGGGWYGGTTTDDNNGGGAGGSGYIGGVMSFTDDNGRTYTATSIGGNSVTEAKRKYVNGQLSNTVNTENGFARITFIQYDLGEFPTIDEIFENIDKIPTDSPIVSCSKELNKHVCDNLCKEIKTLTCTEPHHSGNHYAGDELCYDACHNDAKHKVTTKNNVTDGTFTPGNFINLDWNFQIYYANKGDFFQSNEHGIGALTNVRGIGYTDDMQTVRWTKTKEARFDFNVIHKDKLYLAGNWVPLADKGEYQGEVGSPYSEKYWSKYDTDDYNSLFGDQHYNTNTRDFRYDFYCVEANNEGKGVNISINAYAINNKNMVLDGGTQGNFPGNETNRLRTGARNTSKHSTYNQKFIDVVGRIGNLIMIDVGDYRFSNLFKNVVDDGGTTEEPIELDINNGFIVPSAGATAGANGITAVTAGDGAIVPSLTLEPGNYRITVAGSGLLNSTLSVKSSISWDKLGSFTGADGMQSTVQAKEDGDFLSKVTGPNIALKAGEYDITVTGTSLDVAAWKVQNGTTLLTDCVSNFVKTPTKITFTLKLPMDIEEFQFNSVTNAASEVTVGAMSITKKNTETMKDLVASGNVSIVSSADESRSYSLTLENKTPIEIISMSNGLPITVESIKVQRIPEGNSSWTVEGIVKNVNVGSQRAYMTYDIDIRGCKVSDLTLYTDTYSSLPWAQQAQAMFAKAGTDSHRFPLDSTSNNIDILKDTEVLPGYDVYLSISTLGDYYKNGESYLQVIPEYYAVNLKELKAGNVTFEPVDVYIHYANSYYPVNIWGLVTGEDKYTFGGNGSGLDIESIYNFTTYLKWREEAIRRMVSTEEQYMTSKVVPYFRDADDNNLLQPVVEDYILGNAQFLQMNGKARTFIGGETTYYKPGTNTVDELGFKYGLKNYSAGGRAGSTVARDDSTGIYFNPTGMIEAIKWWAETQRWHFTLSLPSSAVFIAAGTKPTTESIQKMQNDDYVILSTVDIRSLGSVWNLRYTQESSSFNVMQGGTVYNIEIPETITIDGHVHRIPVPIIVYRTNDKISSDVDIIANH